MQTLTPPSLHTHKRRHTQTHSCWAWSSTQEEQVLITHSRSVFKCSTKLESSLDEVFLQFGSSYAVSSMADLRYESTRWVNDSLNCFKQQGVFWAKNFCCLFQTQLLCCWWKCKTYRVISAINYLCFFFIVYCEVFNECGMGGKK